MLEHLIECPSGLSITAREFIVRDEDILADQTSVRKGIAITRLLEAITIKVESFGPYDFENDKVDWTKVLLGDRLVVLLYSRIATWGNLMDIPVKCLECSASIKHTADLEELTIKTLPDTGKEHVASGKPIYVTLPSSGDVVGFRLLVGADEKKAVKLQKKAKKSMSSSALSFRITDIKGVEIQDEIRWVENLGSKDASFLRAEFDRHDGGINHTYEFDCDRCGYEWEADLALGSDFLFPTYKEKVDMNG